MTEKVLVLNHHGLGELLMSLPSIRSLVKESSSMVYMTVSSEFDVQVCQNQRCGEKVFSFKWNESTFYRIKTIYSLRSKQFSTVIAMWGFDPYFVKWFSKIIGAKQYFTIDLKEKDITDKLIKHKLYWNFDVITEYLGKDTKEVLHNDYLLDDADKGIRPRLVSNSFVVIVPGCSAKERYKRWPITEFSNLSKLILAKYNYLDIVLIGTRSENDICEELKKSVSSDRIINLAGSLELIELKWLFYNCELSIGNDNGGMHLAKSCGAKVVVIMGPTNSSLTSPINSDLIIEQNMLGRPWYNRENCKKYENLEFDESMNIPFLDVFKKIEDYLHAHIQA